jgi:hypothetical protein
MVERDNKIIRRSTFIRLAVAGLWLSAGLLYFSTINRELGGFSGDSSIYISLARSIAQGDGYKDIYRPGEPSHTEYAPGLPVLLAPVAYLDDDNYLAMKLVIIPFAVGAVIVAYFLFRGQSALARLFIMAAFATVPLILRFLVEILSDIPYIFFSLLALFMMSKNSESQKSSFISWVLVGVVIAASFFFRQVAVTLGLACFISACFLPAGQRKRALTGLAAGFIIPVALWYLRNYMAAGGLEPEHWGKLFTARVSDPLAGTITFTGFLRRMVRGFFFCVFGGIAEFFPLGPGAIRLVTRIIILLLMLAGLVDRMVRKKGAAEFYVVLYTLLVISWEGWAIRYSIPFAPFFYLYSYAGLRLILAFIFRRGPDASSSRTKWIKGIYGLLALLVLVWNIFRCVDVVRFQHQEVIIPDPDSGLGTPADEVALQYHDPINLAHYFESYDWLEESRDMTIKKGYGYYHLFAMCEWMQRNLPEHVTVICRKPRMVGALSRRYCLQFPPKPVPKEFFSALEKTGADYILADEAAPALRRFVTGLAETYPGRLKEEIRIGKTVLYRFEGDGIYPSDT